MSEEELTSLLKMEPGFSVGKSQYRSDHKVRKEWLPKTSSFLKEQVKTPSFDPCNAISDC